MHLLVVDGPEAVEAEATLVPFGHVLHLAVRLISHAVINLNKFGSLYELVNMNLMCDGLVSGQEDSIVVTTLNKRVRGVTIRSDRGHLDFTICVANFSWLHD